MGGRRLFFSRTSLFVRLAIPGPAKDNCRTVFLSREAYRPGIRRVECHVTTIRHDTHDGGPDRLGRPRSRGRAARRRAGTRPARSPAWWSTCKAVRSPGPTVWGLSYQEKFGPTRSGADGRFRLAALKPDKPVTVWADAPGLARERRDDVRIFPGKDHDIGRLTLLPGTRMRGRVVDAQGKPIAGAGVKLDLYRHQLGHTISSQGTEWTFNAGDDGRFATPPLPAGDGPLLLQRTGQGPHLRRKKAEPGTSVVDLGDVTLPDEMPVAGIVTDGEGKPAPGVEVIPDYDWQNSAKTDKDGRFTVHGVGKDLKSLQPPVERLLHPQAVRRRPRPD